MRHAIKTLRIFSFYIVILLTLLFVNACDNDKQGQTSGLVGKPAPDFTLNNMQGQPVSLSDYRGKVVIVNFWATWCPPCREEMPSMEKLYREQRAAGLELLAINTEENGKRVVSKFLQRTPYSFPILLDSDSEAMNGYRVYRLPESFIVDRNGVVVERVVGARNWLEGPLFKLINSLLSG